jgi:PAS domain S-box-containing protein
MSDKSRKSMPQKEREEGGASLRQMEKLLAVSRRQLESALKAARCGLWDWPDVDKDEAWWSPEFYKLLGYKNGSITPGYSSFMSLLHPEDRDMVLATLDEQIKNGAPYDVEFRLRTRSGDYRWFRGQGQIIDEHDKRHMAGLLQDITLRRHADDTLHKAWEKAEQANIKKTQFLAAASHDLRQPLQSLSLYLAALRRMERPATTDEIIDKMQQSLRTMGQLLRTLLNISRLDAGIVSPEPVNFHVMDLFDNILVNNGPAAESMGLELRVHPSSCVIHSDRVLLEEIIQNFVTNALHNTDRGGVLIGCRRHGGRAWIQVWDTGIGISADNLAVLLNPADTRATVAGQEDNHANPTRPGLGLAIVRQISELLDYRLITDSNPGRGSTFGVEVPVAGTRTTTSIRNAWTEDERVQAGKPVTILLVDNDIAILDACSNVVTTSGHRLECARSRAEAMEQIRQGLRPDIIISDLRLRQYPGTTTIRTLREALGQEVPAILLTGDTSFTETDMRSLPRCRLLYKPVEFEVLNRTIREIAAA